MLSLDLSLKKCSSVPSTIDSPLHEGTKSYIYEDNNISFNLVEEEEIDVRCQDFYENGFCIWG